MKTHDGSDYSKKELLLHTTLELIKKEGCKGFTVRKIAHMADVNVALVNYHFGSKDKLLNEAIHLLVNSFREQFDILERTDLEPKEKLRRFLIGYVGLSKKYPFIVQRLIKPDPFIFESQKEYMNFVKAIGLKKLQVTIAELTGEHDPQKNTIMVSHLLGAIFLPMMVEPLYVEVTGYSMPDIETQIDILLDRYFT